MTPFYNIATGANQIVQIAQVPLVIDEACECVRSKQPVVVKFATGICERLKRLLKVWFTFDLLEKWKYLAFKLEAIQDQCQPIVFWKNIVLPPADIWMSSVFRYFWYFMSSVLRYFRFLFSETFLISVFCFEICEIFREFCFDIFLIFHEFCFEIFEIFC